MSSLPKCSQLKACAACGEDKPVDDFWRSKNRPDGLYPSCKLCANKQRAQAAGSAPAAKQEARLRAKQQYDRQRYQERGEEYRERRRLAHAQNPDATFEQVERWNRANPDRRRAILQSYKHRRRAVESGGMSGAELSAWAKTARKVCYWCGSKCAKSFEVDHYQPLSKGGKHVAENLVIACAKCNRRKSARDPFEFAQMVGRLL